MHDADVRAALKLYLSGLHSREDDTRIVEEMGVWSGAVRIDIAVINGELSGYELKSNSDTLDRLPYQVEVYSKVFDRLTLVVGDRLYEKALSLIPDWWGCTLATMRGEAVCLKRSRKGRRNPKPDPKITAQLLWKDEAVQILARHGLADGWRSRRASEVSERLIRSLPPKVLASEIRAALKKRPRLGQLAPREFDVAIDAIGDP